MNEYINTDYDMCYEHLYFLLQQESFQPKGVKVILLSIYFYYLSIYYYLYIKLFIYYYLYIIVYLYITYILFSIYYILSIYYYLYIIIYILLSIYSRELLLGVHIFLKIVCKIFYEYRLMLFSSEKYPCLSAKSQRDIIS